MRRNGYIDMTPKDDIYDTYTRASQMYLSEQGFNSIVIMKRLMVKNLVSWERIFCIERKNRH